jgi:hypothetical protein
MPPPDPAQLLARIVTADEIMRQGLELAGFDHRRINSSGRVGNYRRFKAWYGSSPIVYAQIWEDLLTTEIAEARIRPKDDLDHFLLALYFLRTYPTEANRSGIFKMCEKTVRKWTWYFAGKIAALKGQKVSSATSDRPFFEPR